MGSWIDTGTVLFGVFGDPVAHSKSPLMMNRAFAESGINAAYAAFRVSPGSLGEAVAGIRALGFRGVNVTIPHKVEVMNYLDAVDERAARIGAVNTIVGENGRLTGYNTDGIGYVRSLKEETGVGLQGKRILLLGAGGAARGIAFALAEESAGEIVIANRTEDKAEALAAAVAETGTTPCSGISLQEIAGYSDNTDIIINTTQIGMFPEVNNLPLDPAVIRPGMLVSDIVYNPRITALLLEAKTRGAAIHSGLGMFIYQGAYAFEYWTGRPAPVEAMRSVVELALDPPLLNNRN